VTDDAVNVDDQRGYLLDAKPKAKFKPPSAKRPEKLAKTEPRTIFKPLAVPSNSRRRCFRRPQSANCFQKAMPNG